MTDLLFLPTPEGPEGGEEAQIHDLQPTPTHIQRRRGLKK